MAVLGCICYSLVGIQSKYVSEKFPRMILSHLNVNAHFIYGLVLMPFFIQEMQKEEPAFTTNDILIIFVAVVINLLACISMAYAFKFGIAARV